MGLEQDMYTEIVKTFREFLALDLPIREAEEATAEAFGLGVWDWKGATFARAVLDHEVERALGTGVDLDDCIVAV